MRKEYLKDVTPEMRLEMQEKARLSRIAKREYAEAHLKTDYADMTYWKSLASELNIRLPRRYDVGVKGIRRVAKQLGVDVQQFVSSTGFSTLNELCKANPTWTSRALACLLIDWYIETRVVNEIQ